MDNSIDNETRYSIHIMGQNNLFKTILDYLDGKNKWVYTKKNSCNSSHSREYQNFAKSESRNF